MEGHPGPWGRRIRFLRDLVVAIGIPALGGMFWTLHTAQVNALEQQIAHLRETQFPRVAEIVEAQRRLYEQEKSVNVELAVVTAKLAADVLKLASDLELVSRPFGAEKEAEKILGKDGDAGSYLEWAGPELRKRANRLSRLLEAPN